MDHVKACWPKGVTAGRHFTAHLCRCVQEGRGHQRGHTWAPGAPGSLTQSVQAGARVAEVTNPGHKGKRKCCQQGGLLCGVRFLCPDKEGQDVTPPVITALKSAGLSILPTGKALDLKCIFTDNMTLFFMTPSRFLKMNHALVHNRENTGQVCGATAPRSRRRAGHCRVRAQDNGEQGKEGEEPRETGGAQRRAYRFKAMSTTEGVLHTWGRTHGPKGGCCSSNTLGPFLQGW